MNIRSVRIPDLGRRCLALLAILVAPAEAVVAQEPLPEGISLPNYEASSYDTLMERTDMGNVAQTARLQLTSAERELKKGIKLNSKAAAMAADDKNRAKTLDKAQMAFQSADKAFREALAFDADLLPAYAGLGTALRLQGRAQEALQVHAMALRRDPTDMVNFTGWTAALLDLNMLGNATSAYTDYAESNPPRAQVLMSAIEDWLAEKKANPGDLDPADIQRLADWVEQQKRG